MPEVKTEERMTMTYPNPKCRNANDEAFAYAGVLQIACDLHVECIRQRVIDPYYMGVLHEKYLYLIHRVAHWYSDSGDFDTAVFHVLKSVIKDFYYKFGGHHAS